MGHGLGTTRKDFSDEQELEIVELIYETFIARGQLFGDSDFELLATQRFAQSILTADP
jgi:hypothetical protein